MQCKGGDIEDGPIEEGVGRPEAIKFPEFLPK